jgi:1,4-dihydroxy-2-naphthoate octaprenyltransferase
MSGPRLRPGRAWLLAIRPATLTVALAPVLVGAAVARAAGSLRPAAVAAALAGAILIQIGTNLANDVFDHEKGADGPDRLGPVRVTSAGLLPVASVRAGMIAAFALATVAGAYLAAVAGPAVVAIGALSIVSGVAYTGGPWPLGYHGLGDVFVFVFFGLVAVCGTAFVASGALPPLAFAAAVPIGAIAMAILVVNNVRDRDGDVRAGKRTLAVRFGRAFGVAEYAVLLGAAYAVPIAIAASRARSPWVLAPLVTVPFAWRLARTVATTRDGPTLNACLATTAKLLLAYAVLFAAGIVR